jgi:hypothetical protein
LFLLFCLWLSLWLLGWFPFPWLKVLTTNYCQFLFLCNFQGSVWTC